jgi:hypothetical protein
MKNYTIVRFGYSDALVIPLEKAAALLELINSPTNRFETSYNWSDDDEALRGAALVPREGVLEIQVVNERELIALQTRGIAELKVRERKTAERRENERLQAEAKEAERVDIEADQEAANPY